MTIAQLKKAIVDMPDDWPVYFRRVAPLCGNIEEAGTVNADKYAFFGGLYDCAIIEPCRDDEENVEISHARERRTDESKP